METYNNKHKNTHKETFLNTDTQKHKVIQIIINESCYISFIHAGALIFAPLGDIFTWRRKSMEGTEDRGKYQSLDQGPML